MIDIKELSEQDLKQKIENIKAEREKTENALKRYEEELERREQEVPLGVPLINASQCETFYWINGSGIPCKEKADLADDVQVRQCSFLNTFHSKESAEKHVEMLLTWRKALVANSKGEPIEIKVLLPLLPKGWVAMTQEKHWLWFENKPYISVMNMWSSCIKKDGHKTFICGEQICPFNIKPAENWETSLMECGL